MRNKIRSRWFLVLLGVGSAFVTSGCGVSRPAVQDASYASAGFSHNPMPSTCMNCHESLRPAPVSGVAHGNSADCIGCHNPGRSWTSGVAFNHNPVPVSCGICHENKRPAPTPVQAHYTGVDCVECHVPSAWVGYKNYSHTPASTSCNSCHENQRPASSTHPSINNVKVTDKSHFQTKDCYACHKAPANATATPRQFTFAHTTGSGANVNFCLPCHYTQGASKHGSNSSYLVGDGTCYNCHNQKRSWNAN